MDPGFERLKDYNLSEEYMISNKQNLKFNLHGHPMDLFLKISVLPLKRWFSSFRPFVLPPLPTPPPPPPPLLAEFCHMTTPKLASNVLNTSVSQVAGCRCTLLAGNSSISLAGSEEQINFSQQSPKMLKMASESCVHALLLFLGLFLKISPWVPLNRDVKAFLD